jgi:hypothetical protein
MGQTVLFSTTCISLDLKSRLCRLGNDLQLSGRASYTVQSLPRRNGQGPCLGTYVSRSSPGWRYLSMKSSSGRDIVLASRRMSFSAICGDMTVQAVRARAAIDLGRLLCVTAGDRAVQPGLRKAAALDKSAEVPVLVLLPLGQSPDLVNVGFYISLDPSGASRVRGPPGPSSQPMSIIITQAIAGRQVRKRPGGSDHRRTLQEAARRHEMLIIDEGFALRNFTYLHVTKMIDR